MPVDTKNQSAAWWAEQCERLRAETDKVNRLYDSAVHEHSQALKAKEKEWQERLGKVQSQHGKERETEKKRHEQEVKRLQAEHERVVAALFAEPGEVRELRECHQQAAAALARQQREDRAALVAKLKAEPASAAKGE